MRLQIKGYTDSRRLKVAEYMDHRKSCVSAMASSKMSKGDSNRCPGRYEWKEVRREECYSTFTKDLFSQNGFHMLSPGASAKVHQVISTQDMSKIKMPLVGTMATITVRLETLTALGAIFMRDTCPDLRYLVKMMQADQDVDTQNGQTDATLRRKPSANTKLRVKAMTVAKTVLKKPARKS